MSLAFKPKRKRGRPPCPMGDGAVLCRARLAVGLTQVQAAREFGVCRETWQRWENGRNRPSLRFMEMIRDSLRERARR